MSKTFFNEKAHEWDDIVNHDSEKIKNTIKDLASSKNPNILDVGSGTGILIPFLVEEFGQNSRITVIDFAENMIKVSREKHKNYDNIDYIVGDIYSINFPANMFDIIICYSVFPHFNDKKAILNRFKFWLKNNGKVLIFHSESRETINNLHKKTDKSVRKDHLPPAIKIANIAEEIGYKITEIIDNEDLYLINLKKQV
ncbi:MAG: class I SAM-dependent methyltransferase [Halanaerobiaceae bacterium]